MDLADTCWVVGAILAVCLAVFIAVVPFIAHMAWAVGLPCTTWLSMTILIGGIVVFPLGWLHGTVVILGFGGLPVPGGCL